MRRYRVTFGPIGVHVQAINRAEALLSAEGRLFRTACAVGLPIASVIITDLSVGVERVSLVRSALGTPALPDRT